MNRELPLIGRMDGPKAVPRSIVESCRTYRDAVRMAWQLKRIKGLTMQQLACEAGLYAPHITDYLHKDDRPTRRDLPADKVAEFESVVGNRVVSQWLAAQSQLTVLEEFQAERMAA
jgi:hypothetical protein